MRCPNCNTDVGDGVQCRGCGAIIHAQPWRSEQPTRGTGETSRGEPQRRDRSPPSEERRGRGRDREPPPGTGPAVPTGVKVACALLGFLGVSLVLGGFVLGSVGGTALPGGPTGAGNALGAIGYVLAGLGLGDLAAVYGLWKLRRWGWTGSLGLLAVGGLASLVVLVGGGGANGLLGLVLHGVLFGYLLTQRSRYGRGRALGRQPGRPS